MKIHEYQAKVLFSRYGIPIEKWALCRHAEEARQAYIQLGNRQAIVKAQVLTGGRGKAGGVKLAHSPEDVIMQTNAILGMNIKGLTVNSVLIGEVINIVSENYLSLTIDRNSKSVVLMLSPEGGMEIEDVAWEKPEKIHRFVIDSFVGIPDFLARRMAFKLFDNIDLVRQTAWLIQNLYRLMMDTDASLVEINPLVLTKEGKIMAIDAKMTFDDNALYRHPDIQILFEPTEEEKKEQGAKNKGFSFVKLDGTIGCMVNGAGLAMATMDVIKFFGGNPANFLDIGGSSNPVKVVEAMKLLLSDPQVKVVLINIFGGITRCDDVATGLLEAFNQMQTTIPVVIRLTGTNEKEGHALLQGSRFILATTMEEATKIAIHI